MRCTDHRSDSARSALVRTVIPMCLGVLLLTAVTQGQPRAEALGYSPLVDEPARYEPQVTCTAHAQPGTLALARWLLVRYPVTRSLGIMRACGTGTASEHKDGRAFDWGADVNSPTAKQAAYHFIHAALASDAAGNRAAFARGLGIMYVIYNDTIWSSYRDFEPRPYLNGACTTRVTCSRALRHLDHVHISLGYGGAAAQTSWFRQRNVPSKPVFYPRTGQLDPDNTAVSPGFNVPATGQLVESPFVLKAGVTYRVVATGAVRYGPGTAVGDANCRRSDDGWTYLLTERGPFPEPPPPADDPWTWDTWGGYTEGSDHPASPAALPVATTHGLTVNKMLRWEGGCRLDHTYEAWLTPTVKQRLALRYVDPFLTDNSGYIRVYVARDDITAASLRRK